MRKKHNRSFTNSRVTRDYFNLFLQLGISCFINEYLYKFLQADF